MLEEMLVNDRAWMGARRHGLGGFSSSDGEKGCRRKEQGTRKDVREQQRVMIWKNYPPGKYVDSKKLKICSILTPLNYNHHR